MALPGNIGFGRVVGRFISSVVDSADPGSDPEAVAATGTVTFTPDVSHVVNASTAPPVTMVMTPTVCTLDADGFLRDGQNQLGVTLIATDDPDMNPTDWTYSVEVSLNNGNVKMTYSISVAEGSEIDLTTTIPLASSGGTAITQGPPGPSAYQAAVANGFVGTEVEWIASLQGGPTVVPIDYEDWDAAAKDQPNTLYVRRAPT